MSTEFNMGSMFRVCAICGKELPVHDVRGYKFKGTIDNKRVYFCSYTCYQKFKREKENVG